MANGLSGMHCCSVVHKRVAIIMAVYYLGIIMDDSLVYKAHLMAVAQRGERGIRTLVFYT